jgi:peptidoglycan/LPS O-acetylase OafA/YrhL
MPRRDTLPALTSLRFFAALAVLVLHMVALVNGPGGPRRSTGVEHLGLGVTFFFVLSGFILTHNYLDHLRSPSARSAWNFLVARWARVYPVHLLAILIVLQFSLPAVRIGNFGEPRTATLLNLGLLQAFAPGLAPFAYNAPAWSLSAEWFFYLCMPLLIPGLATGSWPRRGLVLLLALAPWLVAFAELCGWAKGWKSVGLDPYVFPPVRLADFVAGILLGLCWHRWGAVSRSRSAGATFAEVAAVLVLAGWAWQCVRLTPSGDLAYACRWAGAYLPPFALCIWVFARGGGWLSRVLSTRPLVYLGEISYGIYMFHFPVIGQCLTRGRKIGFDAWPWFGKWALVIAGTLALSALCYHFYEIPLRERLKRWLSARRAAPEHVPAGQPPVAVPLPEAPRRAA